jgi:hypothetical protein
MAGVRTRAKMGMAAALLVAAAPAGAEPTVVANDRFAVTMPSGFHDVSAELMT